MTEVAQHRRRRRWPWAVVLTVLIAVVVAERFALPGVVEAALQGTVDAVGLSVEIAKVETDLLEGRVGLLGVVLSNRVDGGELARAEGIQLDIDWGALLVGSLVLELFALDEPLVQINMELDGDYNWKFPPSESEGDSSPFRISAARIELYEGSVSFERQTPTGPFRAEIELDDLSLESVELWRERPAEAIRWRLGDSSAAGGRFEVATAGGEELALVLAATLSEGSEEGVLSLELQAEERGGSTITVEGSLRPDPLQAELEGKWRGLRTDVVTQFFDLGELRVLEGSSEGSARLALGLGAGTDQALRLSSELVHKDLALELGFAGEGRLALARVEAELEEFWMPLGDLAQAGEAVRVHWSRIDVEEPELSISLGADDAAAPPSEEPASSGLASAVDLRIDDFSLHRGRLDLQDVGRLVDVDLEMARFQLRGGELRYAGVGTPVDWSLHSMEAKGWKLGLTPDGKARHELDIEASTGAVTRGGDIPLVLALTRPGGVELQVEGEANPHTRVATAHAQWRGLRSDYLASLAGFELERGQLDGDLELSISLDEDSERGVRIHGSLSHDDLAVEFVTEELAHTRIEIPRIVGELEELWLPILNESGDLDLEIGTPRVRWKRIEVAEPVLALLLPELDAQPQPEAEEHESDESPPLALDLEIQALVVGKALVDWNDPGLEAEFKLEMEQLEVREARFARDPATSPIRWAVGGVEASGWQLAALPVDGQPLGVAMEVTTGQLTPDGRFPVKLSLSLPDGGWLGAEGELQPDPLEVSAQIEWSELRSERVASLLDLEAVQLVDGQSSGQLRLALMLADQPRRGLEVSGTVSHTELSLALEATDGLKGQLDVTRIDAALAEFWLPIPEELDEAPEPAKLYWTSIEIAKPALVLTLPSAESGAPDPESPQPESAPLLVELGIDRLALREGSVRWRDASIQGGRMLSAVGMDLAHLRWPEQQLDELRVDVGSLGTEPLRIRGRLGQGTGELSLHATRVALAPWNAVLASYSDYTVTDGELSADMRIELKGESYSGPANLVLHRLQAATTGKGFQRTFGMPLTTAIPLLSDPAGNIRLKVPIRGSLSEGAGADIASVLAGAIQEAVANSLTNAVTVPIDLVSAVRRRVVGVFSGSIGEVLFQPGRSELALDGRVSLDAVLMLAPRDGRTRIELVPCIVSDDLRALGIWRGTDGALEGLISAGRSIVGGGRKVKGDAKRRVGSLDADRLDTLEKQLLERGYAQKQILRVPWDGQVLEGIPRVDLRLRP